MPKQRSRIFSWLSRWRTDELHGELTEIYIADAAGASMQRLDSVECTSDLGLAGDRYAEGRGHWKKTDGCQVTLITTAELKQAQRRGASAWGSGWHRRNLVISGIPLAALRRRRLKIGDVLFEYERLRPPCGYLDRIVSRGAAKALGKGGGVGLRVLTNGIIKSGDAVEVIVDPPDK